MTPVVITPPARLPVSLAEMRQQVNIEHTDFDALFGGLLVAATSWVENHTGRALISRTYRATLDRWPSDPEGRPRRWIQLPNPPLISVTSLIYYDDADVATTVDPSAYHIDAARSPGGLTLKYSIVPPITQRSSAGIEITWTAGYGANPGDVEEPLRVAILIYAGWLWQQRGDESAAAEIPKSVFALADPYLVWPLSQSTNGVRAAYPFF